MRGHIRQRGKALEVRVFAGQVDGKKRYLTKTVRWQGSKRATRDLAEQELTKLLGELDTGAHSGPDASVNTLVDRWWKQKVSTWSPSTAARYESAVNAHIRPWFGTMLVRKVRTEDVDEFLEHLRVEKMGPASRAKVLGILRSAFRQAVRWNWIARNPVDNAETVTVRRADIKPPSPVQVRKLIDLARKTDPDWATFIHLDAVIGARRGELCGLRWEDLDGNRLTIRRGIVRSTGNKWMVRETTKSHRERTIPLDKETLRLLKAHRLRCQQRALACGATAGGFMFSYEPDGSRPWHPNSVSQRFRRLRAKAKLGNVRLHDIRHYLASRLLDAGVPAATVAERLGHAHEGITRSIYSHPVDESAGIAADTAARVLRGR